MERYQVTKLIQVIFVCELVARLKGEKKATYSPVTINLVNPGLCTSNLNRSGKKPAVIVRFIRWILDRTTDVGGRTFVLAAAATSVRMVNSRAMA